MLIFNRKRLSKTFPRNDFDLIDLEIALPIDGGEIKAPDRCLVETVIWCSLRLPMGATGKSTPREIQGSPGIKVIREPVFKTFRGIAATACPGETILLVARNNQVSYF